MEEKGSTPFDEVINKIIRTDDPSESAKTNYLPANLSYLLGPVKSLREVMDAYDAEKAAQQSGPDQFTLNIPIYTPPSDLALAQLVHHPSVILIVGHRGGGKTAAACRLQELMRDVASPYAMGLPAKARKMLPDWYGLADDPSAIPSNAVIYIPESYRLYHARSSQTAQGRAIGDLVNLSRHRRHTLIFDVQNPAHLDRNIVSEVDVVLIKQPGPFTEGFERTQFRRIMDQARTAFAGVNQARRKRVVWVVAPGDGIEGQLMENLLPSFWTDGLSRVFSDAAAPAVEKTAGGQIRNQEKAAVPIRRGRKTSAKDKRLRAKQLRQAGYSYSETGKIIGVSKSQAFRLVNS